MKSYRFRNGRRYKRRRRVILLSLAIMVILVLSYLFAYGKNGNSGQTDATPTSTPVSTISPTPSATVLPTPEPSPTPEAPKGTQTIDHGFLPDIGSIEPSGRIEDLKNLVEDFLSQQKGRYGVTFIDLATNESFGIKDTEEYIAASTSKLPINLLLYTKIESGEIDPEMMLEYKKEDLEYGTGIIQNSPYGTKYSVRETSELSLRKSDNCGINMIIRLLDIENVRQYIVDLGGVVYYGPRHRSCPHDMALVAKELYRRYLTNPDVYGEMIEYLETTDWNDRINAQLPKDVRVAHKIGNYPPITANDVGIVFASHPYILSVMTEDVDFGTACKKIAELSKEIYDFVEEYAKEAE